MLHTRFSTRQCSSACCYFASGVSWPDSVTAAQPFIFKGMNQNLWSQKGTNISVNSFGKKISDKKNIDSILIPVEEKYNAFL